MRPYQNAVYKSGQNGIGIKQATIWLPEEDVLKFQVLAERARFEYVSAAINREENALVVANLSRRNKRVPIAVPPYEEIVGNVPRFLKGGDRYVDTNRLYQRYKSAMVALANASEAALKALKEGSPDIPMAAARHYLASAEVSLLESEIRLAIAS